MTYIPAEQPVYVVCPVQTDLQFPTSKGHLYLESLGKEEFYLCSS